MKHTPSLLRLYVRNRPKDLCKIFMVAHQNYFFVRSVPHVKLSKHFRG